MPESIGHRLRKVGFASGLLRFDAFLVLVSLVESWPRLWLFGSRKPWHPEDMYVLTPLAMANDASQGQGDMAPLP